MSATMERKSRAVETEITLDVRLGKFRIVGVPHLALSQPSPTGETVVRNGSVDLKLARMYKYMKANSILTMNYAEF